MCEAAQGGWPRPWLLPRMANRNFGSVTARLPDVPTTADHARARGAPHRSGGAGAPSRPPCARRGADQRRQSVRGGAVQPDLSDRRPGAAFRAAQEAAGHAAAVRPSGRAGIPHPRSAGRDRRAGAARPSPLRGHRHRRHGLLRDGLCGGIGRSGPGLARVLRRIAAARSTTRWPTCWRGCTGSTGARSASATTARKATTSPARSAAGAASTRPRAPTRSPKWTACSRGSPTTFPTTTRQPSSTATTGRAI